MSVSLGMKCTRTQKHQVCIGHFRQSQANFLNLQRALCYIRDRGLWMHFKFPQKLGWCFQSCFVMA